MKENFKNEKIIKFLKEVQGLKIKKTGKNSHFGQLHMTLEGILKKIEPVVENCGLVLVNRGVCDAGGNKVVTMLVDVEKNEGLISELPIVQTDPQKVGSCITYYRRYNLCCLLNLLGDDDDDANIASGKETYQDRKEARKVKKQTAKVEAAGPTNKQIMEAIVKGIKSATDEKVVVGLIDKISKTSLEDNIKAALVKGANDKINSFKPEGDIIDQMGI